MKWFNTVRTVICSALIICFGYCTHADNSALAERVNGLSASSADARIKIVDELTATGDLAVEPLLEAYRLGNLFVWKDNVYLNLELVENDDLDEFVTPADALSGVRLLNADNKEFLLPIEDVEMLQPSRKERKAISRAKIILGFSVKDRAARLAAVKQSAMKKGMIEFEATLKNIADTDESSSVRYAAQESRAIILFKEGTPEQRLEAAKVLGELDSLRSRTLLEDALKTAQPEEKKVYEASLEEINSHQTAVEIFDVVKSGLSTGSILVLMALGLAITFGLMGIINMAHGEMMMIGAYTTYCMQVAFNHTASNPSNWYYVVALPASFLVAMAFGWLIEATVVRRLYKRPLESLLATYGIGLILIQITRLIFGDNRPSNSPTWLQGSFEVAQDMVLPANRLFILFLSIACVLAVMALFRYTTLGLKMRATMQNRDMAAAMGINTRMIDSCTFMLGSGMAGIAGFALTTVGGITPDMGQNYIVDSFLVVVTGGVGNLMGVVCSGSGLGIINKLLESTMLGAVWAKIIVLVIVVAFIQYKPSGLFAMKGRHADD